MIVPPAVARLVARATRPPVTVGSPLAAHLDDAGAALPATTVPPVPLRPRTVPPAARPDAGQPAEAASPPPVRSDAPPVRSVGPQPGTPAAMPSAASPAGQPLPATPVEVPAPGAPARAATSPVGTPRTVPVIGSGVADVEHVRVARATGTPARPVALGGAVARWETQPEVAGPPPRPAALPAASVDPPEVAAWPDPAAPPSVPATPGAVATDGTNLPVGGPAPRATAQPTPVPPVQIGRIEIQVAPPPAETDPFSGCRALEGGVTARRGGGW